MSNVELKNRILEVIKESTEVECELTGETKIIENLCLSSMEIMVMVMDIEKEFRISFPVIQMGVIETLDDLCEIVIGEMQHK